MENELTTKSNELSSVRSLCFTRCVSSLKNTALASASAKNRKCGLLGVVVRDCERTESVFRSDLKKE